MKEVKKIAETIDLDDEYIINPEDDNYESRVNEMATAIVEEIFYFQNAEEICEGSWRVYRGSLPYQIVIEVKDVLRDIKVAMADALAQYDDGYWMMKGGRGYNIDYRWSSLRIDSKDHNYLIATL